MTAPEDRLRGLTPAQIAELVEEALALRMRHEYAGVLTLSLIQKELAKVADALQALPRIEELLVELVEIQRLRAALSREYLDQEETGDEEASKP